MYEPFIVLSDQHSLHWLLTIEETSVRLTRCLLRLVEFYFEVNYKTGYSNAVQDGLSRLKTCSETTLYGLTKIPSFFTAEVKELGET